MSGSGTSASGGSTCSSTNTRASRPQQRQASEQASAGSIEEKATTQSEARQQQGSFQTSAVATAVQLSEMLQVLTTGGCWQRAEAALWLLAKYAKGGKKEEAI